jgi:hypothetical protein
MLSLVANKDVLNFFTIPEQVPCTERWEKLCIDTEKTLFPISAGLLEARSAKVWSSFTSMSQVAREILPWTRKRVHFIQRTAIDFLEGAQGKTLFGKYSIGLKDMLMLYVKPYLVLRSCTRYERSPLLCLFQDVLINPFCPACRVPSSEFHEILPLVHACSNNEARGLVHTPCSVSHENFFLFIASHYRFYEYTEQFLQSSSTYNIEASAYVLIGAFGPYGLSMPRVSRNEHYRVMRDILMHHSIVNESSTAHSSTQRGATDAIMWAWRCFLLHELTRDTKRYLAAVRKQIQQDILSLFIKLGVMAEVPRPRYIIARQQKGVFEFVRNRSNFGFTSIKPQQRSPSSDRTIYVEVNDAWLAQQLLERVHIEEDLEGMVKEDAYMRILLVDNDFHASAGEADLDHITAEFFLITPNGDAKEDSVGSLSELDLIEKFPHEEPSHLKATSLGKFENVLPVLKKIGYDLPDVNNTHVCLHDWI